MHGVPYGRFVRLGGRRPRGGRLDLRFGVGGRLTGSVRPGGSGGLGGGYDQAYGLGRGGRVLGVLDGGRGAAPSAAALAGGGLGGCRFNGCRFDGCPFRERDTFDAVGAFHGDAFHGGGFAGGLGRGRLPRLRGDFGGLGGGVRRGLGRDRGRFHRRRGLRDLLRDRLRGHLGDGRVRCRDVGCRGVRHHWRRGGDDGGRAGGLLRRSGRTRVRGPVGGGSLHLGGHRSGLRLRDDGRGLGRGSLAGGGRELRSARLRGDSHAHRRGRGSALRRDDRLGRHHDQWRHHRQVRRRGRGFFGLRCGLGGSGLRDSGYGFGRGGSLLRRRGGGRGRHGGRRRGLDGFGPGCRDRCLNRCLDGFLHGLLCGLRDGFRLRHGDLGRGPGALRRLRNAVRARDQRLLRRTAGRGPGTAGGRSRGLAGIPGLLRGDLPGVVARHVEVLGPRRGRPGRADGGAPVGERAYGDAAAVRVGDGRAHVQRAARGGRRGGGHGGHGRAGLTRRRDAVGVGGVGARGLTGPRGRGRLWFRGG